MVTVNNGFRRGAEFISLCGGVHGIWLVNIGLYRYASLTLQAHGAGFCPRDTHPFGAVIVSHPGSRPSVRGRAGPVPTAETGVVRRDMTGNVVVIRGVEIHKRALDPDRQERVVDDLRAVARAAPLFTPTTRRGRKMSVRMTSAGRYGWISDRLGYRYEPVHPDGRPWPDIPGSVLSLWTRFGSRSRAPDCCLINHYGEGARMGMHQDNDEKDMSWPVVSISLGDSALFRIGNRERGGSTDSIWLDSGDIAVMGGGARMLYHGIDRIRPGSSRLLPEGGRINVTLRVVD